MKKLTPHTQAKLDLCRSFLAGELSKNEFLTKIEALTK